MPNCSQCHFAFKEEALSDASTADIVQFVALSSGFVVMGIIHFQRGLKTFPNGSQRQIIEQISLLIPIIHSLMSFSLDPSRSLRLLLPLPF
jgi:hypothetical protein